MASEWIWEIDLEPLLGRFVYLETLDGIHRGGRLSAFGYREFELADEMVQIPETVELNGDPEDRLPLNRIKSIKMQ